jgi:flap endonuclease-1
MYRFKASMQDVLPNFQRQFEQLQRYDIVPIYVFDGKPPTCKDNELQKRQAIKTNMRRKVQDTSLPIFDRILASERVQKIPNGHDYEKVKSWLTSNNIQWMVANGDAEKTCAKLTMEGKADVVLSEDFDTLVYGGLKLLTGYSLFPTTKPMVEYDLTAIRNTMQFQHHEFVDFAILCGSDLCCKIRNVGPTKARQFIHSHRNIENTLKFLDRKRFIVPEQFNYLAARKEFLQ